MSYATLGQLKSPGWLNITSTDTGRDTELLRILEDVSIEIDKRTCRWFYCLEGVRYYDGGTTTLLLPDDILSISEIALDVDAAQVWSTTLTTADYLMYPLNDYPKTLLKSQTSKGTSFANGVRAGVKITGVFGFGDGKSAAPYTTSGDTVQSDPLAIGGTSLAVAYGLKFSPGMTLRIGSEQVYVSAVSGNTLTIDRAQNGTTAAAHAKNVAIYIYQYPSPIVGACLIWAKRVWDSRLAGNNITPKEEQTEDLPAGVQHALGHYYRRPL